MTSTPRSAFATHWGDIAAPLLRIGATAYGGPAIMGIMQAELQEKRGWVSKERFVEGLSLVNMLPGATRRSSASSSATRAAAGGADSSRGSASSCPGFSCCWCWRWATRRSAPRPYCAAPSTGSAPSCSASTWSPSTAGGGS